MGIGDQRVHQPVRRHRRIPGERLVDAHRGPVGLQQQILGPARITQRHTRQHGVGLRPLADRLRPRRHRPRIRRLVAPRPRRIDGAQQHLQQVDGAAGVEPIGMCRDAAHRMHRHRPAGHRCVPPPRRIGPRLVQLDRLVERNVGQFAGDAADRRRRDAAGFRHHIGSIAAVEIALSKQMEHRQRAAPVGERDLAGDLRLHPRRVGIDRGGRDAIPGQRPAIRVARDQAIIGAARIAYHQPGGVGVAGQEIQVDAVGLQQFVHQRQHEQPVGAWSQPDPFVGHRGVAGLHRVDRHELRPALLQLCDAQFDRVGVVVLGDPEHQQVFRALPVWLAELPEAAADRIEAARRHVDRTEAAMRGEIGRPELLGPPAGERLALVAPGKQRQLARLRGADVAEPLGGQAQRLLPLDLAEIAGAAFAGAQQRLGQAGRGVVVHDAGRALAAQHAVVHRVVGVALDVADAAVLQVDPDAAAAGAHVAGGGLHAVGDRRRRVDVLHRTRVTAGP